MANVANCTLTSYELDAIIKALQYQVDWDDLLVGAAEVNLVNLREALIKDKDSLEVNYAKTNTRNTSGDGAM